MYVQLRSQRPLPKRKEMPVIRFARWWTRKEHLEKEGQGGGNAQGVADPNKQN
jgi:hypothetical protein